MVSQKERSHDQAGQGTEVVPEGLPKDNIPESEGKTGFALMDSDEWKNKPEDLDPSQQPGDDLPEEAQIFLQPPIYRALNGSGRIILQMERAKEVKDKKSGLIIPGSNDILKPEKEKGPIPFDAMFFVVDYDRDINTNYRADKLKKLGLHDIKNSKDQEVIKKMDANGELDVIRIGDRVFFNHINWMPVRLQVGFQVNFIAHYYDILGVIKSFPRERFEVSKYTFKPTKN